MGFVVDEVKDWYWSREEKGALQGGQRAECARLDGAFTPRQHCREIKGGILIGVQVATTVRLRSLVIAFVMPLC